MVVVNHFLDLRMSIPLWCLSATTYLFPLFHVVAVNYLHIICIPYLPIYILVHACFMQICLPGRIGETAGDGCGVSSSTSESSVGKGNAGSSSMSESLSALISLFHSLNLLLVPLYTVPCYYSKLTNNIYYTSVSLRYNNNVLRVLCELLLS